VAFVNRPPRDPPLPPHRDASPGTPAAQPPIPPGPQPTPILNPPQAPTPAQLIQGTPIGQVFPGRGNPGNPPLDGRTAALRVLGAYLTGLVFCRPGQVGGNPVFFSIPPENFYEERPGPEEDLNFPSIACMNGDVTNRPRGMGPMRANAATKDVFGIGTVLVPQEEREEVIPLEVWSSQLPELRGMVAKLEQAFNPTAERQGFIVVMPDYYGQTARFMLERVEWPDDGAVKNRRMCRLYVFVAFDVVRLVNYVETTVAAQADTEIPAYANPLVVPPNPATGGAVYPSGPRS
jgi:hypothetical protein